MRTDPVVPDGWWATGIDGARGLYEVFGRRPASLEGAVCTLMQFDPFPLNLSVVVELADAPDPLPERWRTRGHDALSLKLSIVGCSLIRLSGPMPAHGCAVDIRPQAGGVRMRLHAQDFDALITAPIKGCIAHMEAHRRADGPEPWPLLYL